MNKTHNDLIFGKEKKMLIVVDTSLLPLREIVHQYLTFTKIEHLPLPKRLTVKLYNLENIKDFLKNGSYYTV